MRQTRFGRLSSSSEERTKVRSRSAFRSVRESNFLPVQRTLGSSARAAFSISPAPPPVRALLRGEIGHCEHLHEQRADVIEMREQALCAFVRFPAKHFLDVGSESVKKILFVGRSFPWHAVAIAGQTFCEGGSTNRGNPALTVSNFPGCTLK
jgi:hypothetical protein